MRVLQNLSNLKVGHFFKKCLFRSGVKSAFIPGAPGELLEDLTSLKKLFRFLPDAHRTLASEE